jgi:prolipoprotein diacylglyceryltransferase
MVFWAAAVLYSVDVFIARFFREDASIWALGLTEAQLSSLVGGVIGLWMLLFLASRARKARAAAGPSAREMAGSAR